LGKPEVAVEGGSRSEKYAFEASQDISFGMPAASPRQATDGQSSIQAAPLSLSRSPMIE